MNMQVNIRKEKEKDYNQIMEINHLAFGQKNEGKLIENLRNNSRYIADLSLVAEVENKLVGHILFFPVNIIQRHKIFESLSLSPMAVLPGFQKKGIGSHLIIKGIEIARNLGFKSIVVLGHKDYYPKYGFEPARKWGIKCPYDVPDEVFMAMEIVNGGLNNISGIVEYPFEFDEVE